MIEDELTDTIWLFVLIVIGLYIGGLFDYDLHRMRF